MELKPRLVWISNVDAKDERERRVLALMRDFETVRLTPSEAGSGLMRWRFKDTVVINAAAPGEAERSLVGNIRGQFRDLTILVRCASSESPLTIGLSPDIRLLDVAEGPELTRARLIKVLAEQRTVPEATPSVPEWRKHLIGNSRPMQKVAEIIRLVGPRRCTVLITGETGTGKEMVAKAIHRAGPRSSGPFVAVNCSAIPEPLLESELFGHVRGAFTGATQARIGRFEQACGGTLFLDEIGDLPLDLQAKMLRVIQEREFQKLGSSETVKTDVRILAATNCDLVAKVQNGTFREDLYYRLNVVPLQLPPLRDRPSDVQILANHFVSKICADEQIALKCLSANAQAALETYDWPGNVRQLENVISSAVILSEHKPLMDAADLSLPRIQARLPERETGQQLSLPDQGLDFTKTVNNLERDLLYQALRKTNGNKKAAAAMLSLKRTTLSAKIRVLAVSESAIQETVLQEHVLHREDLLENDIHEGVA